jgi:cell division protein FtsB
MSYGIGLRTTRVQARRKKRQKVILFLCVLGIIFLFGWFFYKLGTYKIENKEALLLSENEKAQQNLQILTEKIEALEQNMDKALSETKTWQERYQRDVPQGLGKDLYDVMRDKLESGISVDRLSFVIRNTEKESKCSEKPIVKKILLKAGAKSTNTETVPFFDDQLFLQGMGMPQKNADGSHEFWFDPQLPVTIYLNHVTGKKHEAKGVLPFQTNFIVGDHNYHFNVRSGPRGYVHVSGTICNYP